MTAAAEQFRARFTEATRLHQSGQRAAAISLYRQLRVQQPFLPPLLSLLGLALAQEGLIADGLPLLQDAVRRAPNFVDAWLNLAYAQREVEDDQAAIASYRRLLALDPRHLEAIVSLGKVLTEIGEFRLAAAEFQRAAALAPGRALPWFLLRRVALWLEDADLVAEAERQVEGAAVVSADEAYEAGLVRLDQRRPADAVGLLRLALERRPDHPKAALALANALRDLGNPDGVAEAAYREAAALAPRKPEPLILLGNMLALQDRRAEAVVAYQDALERAPANPTAQYLLDAARRERRPMAPAAYVRDTFDSLAQSFDQILVQELQYGAPALIAQRLQALRPPRRFAALLDLGCGTGLVARALQPLTERRVGVDLSPRMLERAQRTGLYVALAEDDVTGYLGKSDERFDLIVAADVFVYLGDLAACFAATAQHLLPDGLFALTTERLDAALGESGDYVLRASGRYAQADGYIEGLAAAVGLQVLQSEQIPLRTESGRPLTGSLFLLRRPAD